MNSATNESHVDLSDSAKEYCKALNKLYDRVNAVNHIESDKPTSEDDNVLEKELAGKVHDFNNSINELINAPEGKLRLDPGIKKEETNKNIAGDTLMFNNSKLYIDRKGKLDIKNEELRNKFLSRISSAYLKVINDTDYMTGLTIDEHIKFDNNKNCYQVTWDFVVSLNTTKVTQEDMKAIKETIAKNIGSSVDAI
ncbi:hypothetical protein [Paraclostridium dentum]|uniref:hypothetical protein n=1 Tax=Paraclostridium dentum TaxID=2662455 RepID=UPI003F2D2A4D